MPGLDAVRAMAILLVIFFHLGFPSSALLGVNAFFVLSGFLITSSLLREEAKTGTISFRRFYKRRAYRIFPTFYLCLVITLAVLAYRHISVVRWEAISTATYTANYGRAFLSLKRQENFPMGSSWSLAIEEQYYLLWPLLLSFLLRTPNKLLKRLCAIIVSIWIYRFALILVFHVSWLYAYNAFDTRVDAILVGSALAVMVNRLEAPDWLLWWLRTRWTLVLSAGLLLTSGYFEYRHIGNDLVWVLTYTLQPVLLLVLTTQAIYWGHLTKVLRARVFAYVAHISYALYLYHPIVLTLQPSLPVLKQRPTELIVMFLVASASFYLVEQPIMRIRDRRDSKRRLATVGDAAQMSA